MNECKGACSTCEEKASCPDVQEKKGHEMNEIKHVIAIMSG